MIKHVNLSGAALGSVQLKLLLYLILKKFQKKNDFPKIKFKQFEPNFC